MKSQRRLFGFVVLLVALFGFWWFQGAEGSQDGNRPSSAAQGSPQHSTGADGSASSGLGHVAVAGLPREAQQTLQLIDAGGPFPYDRDGVTFENFEKLLPQEPRGFYTEYTVPTPGSDDRGARRLVVGDDGAFYYTDDHYASFRRVDR
jgi:ribonuclease T1